MHKSKEDFDKDMKFIQDWVKKEKTLSGTIGFLLMNLFYCFCYIIL